MNSRQGWLKAKYTGDPRFVSNHRNPMCDKQALNRSVPILQKNKRRPGRPSPNLDTRNCTAVYDSMRDWHRLDSRQGRLSHITESATSRPEMFGNRPVDRRTSRSLIAASGPEQEATLAPTVVAIACSGNIRQGTKTWTSEKEPCKTLESTSNELLRQVMFVRTR